MFENVLDSAVIPADGEDERWIRTNKTCELRSVVGKCNNI